MYFRYKAEKVYSVFSEDVKDYSFEIQSYQPNKLKKWKRFCSASLTEMLVVYNCTSDTRSLETCLNLIKQNGGIENIMKKYIEYTLQENENNAIWQEKSNKVIDELDELLISKKWKPIHVFVKG